jgi:crotonobetainyl-CoA:carnitine CoA-transferase CaiB-like acyl-CoA transferase
MNAIRRGALDGIRVIDVSHVMAGPFCAMLLADLGADVIKIEPPAGDIARAWGPPFYGTEPSYVISLHRNKQSVVIDFKHAEGKELFFKLVERADVVLENYRVGVIDKLGLGYEAARARNPRIIYCALTGYGQSGPRAMTAAHDLNYAAEAGMLALAAGPDGAPVPPAALVADIGGGGPAARATCCSSWATR